MNFHVHRPNQHFDRSERALMRIATDLTSFLLRAQRSLTFETLHLSKPQREAFAHILVEFAEDLSRTSASGAVWNSTISISLAPHSPAFFQRMSRTMRSQ
jgi:hypothetical protein